MYEKIGKFEAIGLILTIMINHIILNIPNSILRTTGTAAVLNTIYISIIAVVFSILIVKLFKPFQNADILDISHYLGGNILKIIIGVIYIIFFLFISGLLLRYFTNSLKLIYFPNTPLVFLLILFIIPVYVCNKLGLKAISQINLMFIPILILSVGVVAISTFKYAVPQALLPILGYGFNKTFLIGSSNIFAFGGLAYLYFLPPLLKQFKKFKAIALTSTIISAISLLLAISCLLMVFSYIFQSDEMLSGFLLTRMMQYGRFFQRVDAIFIFFWILSMFSYLSVTLFFILNVFKKITKIKRPVKMSLAFVTLLFVISLSIDNIAIIKYLEQVVYKYFTLILVFGISLLILILANIKLKKSHKEVELENK